MAICPVANSVGCEKCGVVKICLLRSVLGNYGEARPDHDSEDTTVEIKPDPPDT